VLCFLSVVLCLVVSTSATDSSGKTRLRNDVFCVKLGVKLLVHSLLKTVAQLYHDGTDCSLSK